MVRRSAPTEHSMSLKRYALGPGFIVAPEPTNTSRHLFEGVPSFGTQPVQHSRANEPFCDIQVDDSHDFQGHSLGISDIRSQHDRARSNSSCLHST